MTTSLKYCVLHVEKDGDENQIILDDTRTAKLRG